MRCDCCNERLTSTEAVLKHKIHGMYLNTCIKCLNETNIPYKGFVEEADDDLEFEYNIYPELMEDDE